MAQDTATEKAETGVSPGDNETFFLLVSFAIVAVVGTTFYAYQVRQDSEQHRHEIDAAFADHKLVVKSSEDDLVADVLEQSSEKVDQLQRTLSSLEEKGVENLPQEVDALGEEVGDLKSQANAIGEQQNSNREMAAAGREALRGEVTQLNTRMTDAHHKLGEQFGAFESALEAVGGRVAALEALGERMTQLEGDLKTHERGSESMRSELTMSIETVRGELESIRRELGSLNGKAATLTEALEAVKSAQAAHGAEAASSRDSLSERLESLEAWRDLHNKKEDGEEDPEEGR